MANDLIKRQPGTQVATVSATNLPVAVSSGIFDLLTAFAAGPHQEEADKKRLLRIYAEAVEGFGTEEVAQAIKQLKFNNPRNPFRPTPQDLHKACRKRQLAMEYQAKVAEMEAEREARLEAARVEKEKERVEQEAFEAFLLTVDKDLRSCVSRLSWRRPDAIEQARKTKVQQDLEFERRRKERQAEMAPEVLEANQRMRAAMEMRGVGREEAWRVALNDYLAAVAKNGGTPKSHLVGQAEQLNKLAEADAGLAETKAYWKKWADGEEGATQ